MSKTQVPLSQIRDNPHQPRMDVGDVEGLADSILQHGVRQLPEGRLLRDNEPISGSITAYTHREDPGVWVVDHGPASANTTVQLASGHRRTEAIRLLNEDDTITDADLKGAGLIPGYVPVDLQRLSDEEMLDLGTIENVQREGLSPIEEARQIQEHKDFGRTNAEIGAIFGGRSASWVSSRTRLLNLPTYVQEHIHDGDLSVREGQSLVKAFELEEEHPELAQKIGASLNAGNITKSALRGDIDSDGIRSRVQDLEDAIELAQRAEKSNDNTDSDGPQQAERDHEEDASGDGADDPGARAEDRASASRDDTGIDSTPSAGQGHEDQSGDPEGVSADVSRIVLVACSKSKASMAQQAQALYKGQLFRKSKAYAQQLVESGEADAWYILSAKHGLLEPMETVEPYDETLADADGERRIEWAADVYGELQERCDLEATELVVLGGRDYYQPLDGYPNVKHDLEAHVTTPFNGMAGNGEMMQWLDEQTEDPVDPEPTAREMRENSGDGAPAEDQQSSHNHPAHLPMLIDAVERDGMAWQVGVGESGYQARLHDGDEQYEVTGASTPVEALQEARTQALNDEDDPIGMVDTDDVDALLSCDSLDMWDEEAAERASIASLLVAHRVASARQETWRTRVIAETVQDRVGSVTEEDVPDEVTSNVHSEVDRRTSVAA